MVRGALIAAVVVVAGPCSALAQAGAEILIVRDHGQVASCERLGEVRGSSLLGGVMTNVAYGRAMDQMKRRATALGATHIEIIDVSSGFAGSNALGTAYRCSPTPSKDRETDETPAATATALPPAS
jgi:hypothetical protein